MPSPEMREQLLSDFSTFNIRFSDDDVLDKALEQCILFRLDVEDYVASFVAFVTTKQLPPEPTLELLNQLEREELSKHTTKPSKKPLTQRTNHIYTSSTIDNLEVEEAENLLETYGTPTLTNHRDKQVTPKAQNKKRILSQFQSPGIVFSPGSISPNINTTPSEKYNKRTNSLEVVCKFGETTSASWKGSEKRICNVECFDGGNNLTKPYKYMFEKLNDKCASLNDMIEDWGHLLQKKHAIEEFAPIRVPALAEITVLGRICCDSVGRLNSSSLLLEGTTDTCGGHQLPLDVSNLSQYSLFPGQFVAVKGMNNTGKKFVAQKLYNDITPSFSDKPLDVEKEHGPLEIVVASGPFTTSDNLLYEPLTDFMNYIENHKPDICILMGPFLDSKHEEVEKGDLGETYDDFFSKLMDMIVKRIEGLSTQLIIVPSLRDIHHSYIYPIPPFKITKYKDIHFVSDPCLLNINGLVIGMSSTDILFHLGRQEISFPSGSSDRLARLVHHLLIQHSFYPLYPPAEEVNIDYEQFEIQARFTVTPHLLILPSDLKGFIKDVQGCCCINPERLAKGQSGGSFARVEIDVSEAVVKSSLIKAEIIKI